MCLKYRKIFIHYLFRVRGRFHSGHNVPGLFQAFCRMDSVRMLRRTSKAGRERHKRQTSLFSIYPPQNNGV